MLSRAKKGKSEDLTQRSQYYLSSDEAKKKQYKILSAVGILALIAIFLLHKMGLFSSETKTDYTMTEKLLKAEDSTNKILSAWGSANEALKFANSASTAEGYLSVQAMVIQSNKSVKKQDIQIFYREASKLNPIGLGISNHLQRIHDQFLKPVKQLKKGLERLRKKADEAMDAYVVDKDITVIFLHGQDYVSNKWEELGTLDYFANAGYKIYGIDMPGYGHSQKVSVKGNLWLIDVIIKLLSSQDQEGVIDIAKSNKVIHKIAIVSPDRSSKYTLPLLSTHQELLGVKQGIELDKFISVSLDAMDRPSTIPSDIEMCNIYGERDTNALEGVSDAQSYKIEGSYLDKPDVFHNVIHSFLVSGKCQVTDDLEEGNTI